MTFTKICWKFIQKYICQNLRVEMTFDLSWAILTWDKAYGQLNE